MDGEGRTKSVMLIEVRFAFGEMLPPGADGTFASLSSTEVSCGFRLSFELNLVLRGYGSVTI